MHIHIDACTHVYIHIFWHNYTYMYTYIHTYIVYSHTYRCICMSACICMYVYVCMYMYVCVCMYMYVCMYVCICMCVCTCMCMCVYAYMCMYICITYWGGIVRGEMSYPKQEGELSGGNCPGELSGRIVQGEIVLHPHYVILMLLLCTVFDFFCYTLSDFLFTSSNISCTCVIWRPLLAERSVYLS